MTGWAAPVRPAIVVVGAGPEAVTRAVLAGIEEEGVPFVLEHADAAERAIELAAAAALRSPLEVGVGIDRDGTVCVQPAKVACAVPELVETVDATDVRVARILGHNAARLCVGLPLKDVAPSA